MPKPRVVRAKSCETQVSKRSTSNPELASAEPPVRTKRRAAPPLTVAVIGVAALIALFATTDRGRSPTDALEECEDYAATLKRCFGENATFHAPPPPSTEPERAAAAKRCAADRVRIERACR